jgi:hypothetical protein
MTRSFLSVPLLFEHPDTLFSSPARAGPRNAATRAPATGGPLKEKYTPKGEVAELSTAFIAALHRPATRLPASNSTTTKTSFAIAVTAAAPSSLPAPTEGSPLGGGRVIRRLVHSILRPPQVPLASLRILHPLARGVDIIARDYVKVDRRSTRRRELARARSENAGFELSRFAAATPESG